MPSSPSPETWLLFRILPGFQGIQVPRPHPRLTESGKQESQPRSRALPRPPGDAGTALGASHSLMPPRPLMPSGERERAGVTAPLTAWPLAGEGQSKMPACPLVVLRPARVPRKGRGFTITTAPVPVPSLNLKCWKPLHPVCSPIFGIRLCEIPKGEGTPVFSGSGERLCGRCPSRAQPAWLPPPPPPPGGKLPGSQGGSQDHPAGPGQGTGTLHTLGKILELLLSRSAVLPATENPLPRQDCARNSQVDPVFLVETTALFYRKKVVWCGGGSCRGSEG